MKILIIITMLLIIAIPYRSFWFPMLRISLGITAILIFFEFIWPLIVCRSIKGYKNKMKQADEIDRSVKIWTDHLAERFGPSILIIIAFIASLFMASNISGRDTAQRQEQFYIPSTNEQLVVLRIYGDNLICAPLDRETKEINGIYYILDKKDIALTPEQVGPLTLSSDIPD